MSQYSQKITRANATAFYLVIALSVLVGIFACSRDSLWIDEAWVALIASEKSLSGWWARMQEISGSTLQMPLYTLWLWCWEKVAGQSEWALRAANIPFFVLGQWALFRSLRDDKRLASWCVAIAAASPFLWSYIAEARPYAMQYGAACLVVGSLVRLATAGSLSARELTLFCLGLMVLCGTSSLAFPWAGMAILSAFVLAKTQGTLSFPRKRRLLLLATTGACLAAIFAYDLWAAHAGGKASTVGRTNWQSLLFVCYELLGFGGLGPPRLEIRATQTVAVLWPYFVSLAALLIALFLNLIRLRGINRAVWQALLLYAVVPLLFVIALALFAPFRLLGRHVMPIAPVLFILLAFAAAQPPRWWLNRAFLILWLVSAVTLRLHPRHQRDDYRGAAEIARVALAKGEQVWWAADAAGAEYYKVSLTKPPTESKTSALLVANRGDLQLLAHPDLVILSKGDIFDSTGTLQRFLTGEGYLVTQTLPAFTIWRKSN